MNRKQRYTTSRGKGRQSEYKEKVKKKTTAAKLWQAGNTATPRDKTGRNGDRPRKKKKDKNKGSKGTREKKAEKAAQLVTKATEEIHQDPRERTGLVLQANGSGKKPRPQGGTLC